MQYNVTNEIVYIVVIAQQSLVNEADQLVFYYNFIVFAAMQCNRNGLYIIRNCLTELKFY